MADKCIWTGASDKKYEYFILKIGADWSDMPGNYIFAYQSSLGKWKAVYIGETESFKDRLPNHDELPCILRNGGTHIHSHVNQDKQARLDEERDLLADSGAPCND
jgi:hypothetical protein